MEGEIEVRWRWGEGGGKPAGNSPATRATRLWAAEPGWGRSQALGGGVERRGRSAVQSARRRRRAEPLPAAPDPCAAAGEPARVPHAFSSRGSVGGASASVR